MDIFSLFLGSSISGAISGAVGSIIKVFSKCPICAQRDDRKIPNRSNSHIDCSNCHNEGEQFANVCNFTVDSVSKRIGVVGVKLGNLNVDANKLFYRDGFLWLRKNHYSTDYECGIPFELKVDGLKNRSIVLELLQKPFPEGDLLDSQMKAILSKNDTATTKGIIVPDGFKIKKLLESGKVIACDINVKSEFGDILFEGRKLLQHDK